MTDSKHTPGQSDLGHDRWRQFMTCPSCGNKKDFDFATDQDGREVAICPVDDCHYEDDYTCFAGDLITSAPDLLEALEEIDSMVCSNTPYGAPTTNKEMAYSVLLSRIMSKIRNNEAIARAKGE